MKKSNKVIAVVLSLALLLTAVGGTIAWLTDKDKAENVFTVGNIDIEILDDETRIDAYRIKDGRFSLLEGDVSAKATKDETVTNGTKYTFSGLVPGNMITINRTVENLGKNDAYVRVAVVMNNVSEMNKAIDDYFEPLYKEQFKRENPDKTNDEIKAMVEEAVQKIYDEMFNISDSWKMQHGKTSDEPVRLWLEERENDGKYLYSDMAVKISQAEDHSTGYYRFSPTNHFTTELEDNDNGHDGTFYETDPQDGYYNDAIKYNERIYVFYLKLAAHEEDGFGYIFTDDQYTPFNGIKVPTCFDNENMAAFENLEIGVYADAIQVDGFKSADEAFQALEDQHPLGWWN